MKRYSLKKILVYGFLSMVIAFMQFISPSFSLLPDKYTLHLALMCFFSTILFLEATLLIENKIKILVQEKPNLKKVFKILEYITKPLIIIIIFIISITYGNSHFNFAPELAPIYEKRCIDFETSSNCWIAGGKYKSNDSINNAKKIYLKGCKLGNNRSCYYTLELYKKNSESFETQEEIISTIKELAKSQISSGDYRLYLTYELMADYYTFQKNDKLAIRYQRYSIEWARKSLENDKLKKQTKNDIKRHLKYYEENFFKHSNNERNPANGIKD